MWRSVVGEEGKIWDETLLSLREVLGINHNFYRIIIESSVVRENLFEIDFSEVENFGLVTD